MAPDYVELEGEVVDPDAVFSPKAKEVVGLLRRPDSVYTELVECRATDQTETIVVDLHVEVPQQPVNKIRRLERIAIRFMKDDTAAPDVLALRVDFPSVPHLNLRDNEFPRSLCLYDVPYEEQKLRWRGAAFVEGIRDWLRLTARGQLHDDDQPLEPLLLGSLGVAILPGRLFSATTLDAPDKIHLSWGGSKKRPVLIVEDQSTCSEAAPQVGIPCVATIITCDPQVHGVIRRAPHSLKDLHDLVAQTGTDLLSELRGRFKAWHDDKDIREHRFVLILRLPKRRDEGEPPETCEIWLFASEKSVSDVGVSIGAWWIQDGEVALGIVKADETKQGDDIGLCPLSAMSSLTRNLAAELNGLETPVTTDIGVVGLGALGSQVTMNLARAGVGVFTLIDDDLVLPHNLSRHSLDGFAVGGFKGEVLAHVINKTIDGENVASSLTRNVLRHREQTVELATKLKEHSVILDMSASVPVARYLARDIDSQARRVSMFLSPAGTYFTLLAEDTERTIRLDALEMQLYRKLISDPAMTGYFLSNRGNIRYGQSCRDVTVQLPQHLVGLHAAIGARAFLLLANDQAAAIRIWRADPNEMTVECIKVEASEVVFEKHGDWTVFMDTTIMTKLRELRAARLPNETGGVLIGSFDMQRKIAYIVDTIPSPPDSKEYPKYYVRGCAGLRKRMEQAELLSGGMLHYAGEWHSHPDNHDVQLSRDDVKAFDVLTDWMGNDGLPPILMIVGEQEQYELHIAQLNSASDEMPSEGP